MSPPTIDQATDIMPPTLLSCLFHRGGKMAAKLLQLDGVLRPGIVSLAPPYCKRAAFYLQDRCVEIFIWNIYYKMTPLFTFLSVVLCQSSLPSWHSIHEPVLIFLCDKSLEDRQK